MREQKGEIDSNTVIKGDYNTILSIMGRTFREKVSKKKMNLKQHYRPNGPSRHIHSIASKSSKIYTFLSAQETFSRIDHILGHKKN